MKVFYKIISYVFHPIFIPIYGTLSYFLVSKKYTTLAMKIGNLLPIFILTVMVPIICFLILRNMGLVNSVFFPSTKARKYPLFISLVLLLMIIYKVIPYNYTAELYYFFIGLIIALFTYLMLLFVKFKGSLHMLGIGTLTMYLINLSIHFEINLTFSISLLILMAGLIASSRLYFRAHNTLTLGTGLIIGIVSQFITIPYWL